MDVDFSKFRYNKTTVGDDGITHTTDTTKDNIGIRVTITGQYHTNKEEEFIELVLADLKRLQKYLKDLQKRKFYIPEQDQVSSNPLLDEVIEKVKKEIADKRRGNKPPERDDLEK